MDVLPTRANHRGRFERCAGFDMTDPDRIFISAPKPSNRLVIEFIKSQQFRVVHVDGAIGGPTLAGLIHLAVFSERAAIPRRIVASVVDGIVGDPIAEETVVRDGVIREIDTDMIMSVSAAEDVIRLLTKIVASMKAASQNNTTGSE
jgi:hypothetical protein